MSNSETAKPDVMSIAASYAAVLFVVVSLIYRVAKGHWGAVAFMALIAIMVTVFYIRHVPLGDLDDDDPEE